MYRNHTTLLWVCFWGMITLVAANSGRDWGLTVSIITVCFVVGGILVGIFRWLWGRYWAAKMVFLIQPLNYLGDRDYEKSKIIQTGKQEIIVLVTPQRENQFERINIRFVKRKLTAKFKGYRPRIWEWCNVPQSIITIEGLNDEKMQQDSGYTHQRLRVQSDEVGGFNGYYDPPYRRSCDDSLWLSIAVKANRPWRGHLSFWGNLGDHRGYVRRTFTVTDNEVKDG